MRVLEIRQSDLDIAPRRILGENRPDDDLELRVARPPFLGPIVRAEPLIDRQQGIAPHRGIVNQFIRHGAPSLLVISKRAFRAEKSRIPMLRGIEISHIRCAPFEMTFSHSG